MDNFCCWTSGHGIGAGVPESAGQSHTPKPMTHGRLAQAENMALYQSACSRSFPCSLQLPVVGTAEEPVMFMQPASLKRTGFLYFLLTASMRSSWFSQSFRG